MEDFENVKFGDVCDFVRGPFGGSLKKNSFVNDGFAVYEQQHAIYNQFNDIRYYVDEKKFQEMKRFELQPKDIIMSCSGTMGKVAIVPDGIKRGIINQALLKLTPKSSLNVEYLKYWMTSPQFGKNIQEYSVGSAIKNVASVKVLKQIYLPLHPINKQKQIVETLDKAFEKIDKAIANTEQNLQNAKQLFESYLQSVFENKGDDWEEKTLGKVCKIIGGGTPSKKIEGFYTGNILWATVRDMKSEIIKNTQHKITTDAVKNSSTNIIPKGNVIIATRVGLGKVCILEKDSAINQDLKAVIPKKDTVLSIPFLFRWFTSISEKIINEGTGATVQGVKLTFINSLPISIPPIKEQKEIVIKLDALSVEIKKLKAISTQKIADLEEMKKSILEKAFKGELTSAA